VKIWAAVVNLFLKYEWTNFLETGR